jgi:oxalate decarboxylase/phosphoglucose isomerase-like protein (cupin superfamily)
MATVKKNVVDAGAIPTQSFEWGAIKWFITPDMTADASMTLGEVVLLPGQGHEWHNHPNSEEVLYVLSGEGEQMIDDEESFPVRPGDTIYVPTAVFHSTYNTGWSPLRLLAIYNPGGPEKDLEGLPDFLELSPGHHPEWKRT